MESRTGAFIVIEAPDASTSQTYVDLLEAQLSAAGHTVVSYQFPRLGEHASYFVGKYTANDYGDQAAVSPYTAALLFALDRYDAAPAIREALVDGAVVLCSNYVGANMADQGRKFALPEERRGFYIWLDNLEFQMLGIPRPNLSLVLLPGKVPAQLATSATLLELSQLFPKDFVMLPLDRSGTLLQQDAMLEILRQKIAPYLPDPDALGHNQPPVVKPVTHNPAPHETSLADLASDDVSLLADLSLETIMRQRRFATPTLREDIVPAYKTTMGKLYDGIADIWRQSVSRLSADERRELEWALLQTLPVATLTGTPHAVSSATSGANLTADLPLGNNHDVIADCKLVSAHPSQELALLPAVLFGSREVSLATLQDAVNQLPIIQKFALLEQAVVHDDIAVMRHIQGGFEVLLDLVSASQLATAGLSIVCQPLSRRHGFTTPSIIEKIHQVDAYQALFDASFSLHSRLIAEKQTAAARYACLSGHKVHLLVQTNAAQINHLYTDSNGLTEQAYGLVRKMRASLSERYPTIIPDDTD